MRKLMRRLGIGLLIAVALLCAGAMLLAETKPVLTGRLMLRTFDGLPPALKNAEPSWRVARSLLLRQCQKKMPAEVEKESRGLFGPRADYLVVSLGDSTTAGQGVDPIEAWPFRLQKKLGARLYGRVRVINAGISGETAPQGLRRLERDVLPLSPDLVTVGYLINDTRVFSIAPDGTPRVLVEHQQYLDSLAEILAVLRTHDIPVILFTCHRIADSFFTMLPPEWPLMQSALFEHRVKALRGLIDPLWVTIVDTYSAIDARPDAAELYQVDGFHLKPTGHRLVADLIFQEWMATVRPTLPPKLVR